MNDIMKNLIFVILFIPFFTCTGQEKNMNMQEELTDAFETIKYIVEKEGVWFYSGEKHFNFLGKQIKHTIGTNTITIQNIYPTTSEGLQGDIDIIEYYIKRDTHNQVTFWKGSSSVKQSDKTYNKILFDINFTYKELRHYTFDHFYLITGETISFNGLDMTLLSIKNNSDLQVKIKVNYKNKIDTLEFSIGTSVCNFEGFSIVWKYPELQIENDKFHFQALKKHELPVWNNFLESKFNPNIREAEKRRKAIYKVASKWDIPINVQFITASLSHDPRIERNRVESIIKQNKKIFAIYENHFEKEWKKHFDKEVEEIIMK